MSGEMSAAWTPVEIIAATAIESPSLMDFVIACSFSFWRAQNVGLCGHRPEESHAASRIAGLLAMNFPAAAFSFRAPPAARSNKMEAIAEAGFNVHCVSISQGRRP
ncbi:hypothetical protein Q1M63_08085 (plasmid) [Sinorhizobium meliloti]|nr:hypothetical protein CN243_08015 [Sinorhizobium meliloti]WKL24744.1 hypothetical protein Q1M63_08085 [Sinorhizobium meliloti]